MKTKLVSDSANILLRCEKGDEYIVDGCFYSWDCADIPKDAKRRYAVEYCFSYTGDIDDIDEYGMDYEYFDTEKEAIDFVENTILVPEYTWENLRKVKIKDNK